MKFTILVDPKFLGHHTCILTLYVQCLEEEKIFKRNNAILQCTYDHALAKNPCPRGHEIKKIVDPSLLILRYTLSVLCRGEGYNAFLLHNYKATPKHKSSCPGGDAIYKFC